ANDLPLLQNCTARFQCETEFEYEGGDHIIFVGKVLSVDQNETAPLVFHDGRYAHAAHREDGSTLRVPYLSSSFNESFLPYLLGRCHYRFFDRLKPHLCNEG